MQTLIRTLISGILFLLKISLSTVAFYWHNDTLGLCHLTMFIPNQCVPELVHPLACSSYVYCYLMVPPPPPPPNLSIIYISFLDKCHTSAFNTLISKCRYKKIKRPHDVFVKIHHLWISLYLFAIKY